MAGREIFYHKTMMQRIPWFFALLAGATITLSGCLPESEPQKQTVGPFVVSYATTPAPVPLNEPFNVRVNVVDTHSQPVTNVTIRVNATMPTHGHGMNVAPTHTAFPGGVTAQGLLFHMPGQWELHVDLEAPGKTTRAVFPIHLKP